MDKITPIEDFDSLIELVMYFKDHKTCMNYLEQMRWKGEIHCPHCGMDKIYRFKDGIRFKCGSCREQFTAKVGTIFESSKLSMLKWYTAIYFVNSHKKGISSHQLAKDIKVTQKTAWFMLQRIRFALGQDYTECMDEIVECDESFIGGKNKNRHKDKKVEKCQGRSFKDKTPVFGIMQRGGQVRTKVVRDTSANSIEPIIRSLVKPGAIIISDEWWAYRKLCNTYEHYIVDHSRGEYVREGWITTNSMEGFWTWIKRAIMGVYHQVSPRHLQFYMNEVTHRYNHRLVSDNEKMKVFMSKVGVRLKYEQLIRA